MTPERLVELVKQECEKNGFNATVQPIPYKPGVGELVGVAVNVYFDTIVAVEETDSEEDVIATSDVMFRDVADIAVETFGPRLSLAELATCSGKKVEYKYISEDRTIPVSIQDGDTIWVRQENER